MSGPKIAIVIHTTFGTIHKRQYSTLFSSFLALGSDFICLLVAEAEKAGIERAGGKADLFQ